MEMLIGGVVVKAYADNDGGLWYYDPVTGRTETVNEQSNDIGRIPIKPHSRQKRKIKRSTRMDGRKAL